MREKQYNPAFKTKPHTMGPVTSLAYRDDPRHLAFSAARYKFVAKMLAGSDFVLEVGCGDAFFSPIVAQAVGHLTVTDADRRMIRSISKLGWDMSSCVHDMVKEPMKMPLFSAAYSIDVIEHMIPTDQLQFMKNLRRSLTPTGVAIVGTPSLESQAHASPRSVSGHINCLTGSKLRYLMDNFFHNVFLFGMNDETLHTGFDPMCHYRFAIGANPR